MLDPITAITGFAALSKAAIEIASTADAAKRNAMLIEFQQALIQTQGITATEQAKNALLTTRNKELEAEIAQLKDWSAKKHEYLLTEVASGVFAYIKNSYMGTFRSAHKLCANCFEQDRESTLQCSRGKPPRVYELHCHRCKTVTPLQQFIGDGVKLQP